MKLLAASLLVSILVSLTTFALAADELTHIVQLKHGKVHGRVVTLEENKKVEFFEGIKYAESKRFEKPTAVHPWPQVYPATSKRDACIQFGALGGADEWLLNLTKTFSEDCLYLNIWRPAEVKANRTVMVFIHGGAFEVGTIFTDIFNAQYFSSKGDVVVVTINYRLGPFGFATGGHVTPNLGLHDQIFALKWVQENIAAFGGNPADVTIFGESAGSISVGALVLSPLAKGLFYRAILQSGAPTARLVAESISHSLEKTKITARKVNCTVDSHLTETMNCLAKKSVKDLKAAQVGDFLANTFYVPVYGDEVLPLKPEIALKEGKFNHVDIIYGVTRNEGSAFAAAVLPNMITPHFNYTLESAKADIIKMMTYYQEEERVAKEVADFYLKKLRLEAHIHAISQNEFRRVLGDVWGDYQLVCPTILYAEEVAKHQGAEKRNLFAYRLMQDAVLPGVSPTPSWMGVTHGQDMFYLFLTQLTKQGSPLRQLSEQMIHAWTSFAKTGSPAKLGSGGHSVAWEKAVKGGDNFNTRYMHLEASFYHMVDDYWKDICDSFWKPKMFSSQ